MQDKIERMKELSKIVSEASIAYYVNDNPIMSDKQWDKLYSELVLLEKETGVVLPDSPTQKIGGDALDKFVKASHVSKLYSLDKAQSFEEILDWQSRNQNIMNFDTTYSVEYKFDGLPIAVEYDNGVIVRALTRGNGEVGEDVTLQAKTIRSLPLSLAYKGHIVVQGEVIMKLSELAKFNNDAEEKLKNARNAAAGALRNLDPKITASRNLDFFAYNINYSETDYFESQQQIHDFLVEQKFLVAKFFEIVSSVEQIKKFIDKIDVERHKLDFLIDGLVIKINSKKVQEELGFTAKFPRGMLAYKFDAEETDTKLLGITWQVGRTGKLTPVAELEPVELCGVTVKRATLNNFNDILRKKVKIGDQVFIRRSNEVIPEILSVARTSSDSKEIEKPEFCPSCHTRLIETVANLYCPNHIGCKKQIVGRLTHFAGRQAMNIEGLSIKTVELLHEKFGTSVFADLYKLTFDELFELEGFKEKKTQNILDGIAASKKPELSNLIYALGIDGVGQKMARTLAAQFGSIEKLSEATIADLDAVPDIAEISATDIVEYFADEFNRKQIEDLFKIGVEPINSSNSSIESELLGKKVVLTGGLDNFSRIEATSLLEKLGAVCTSSVSKSTDLVVVGKDAGSKLDKAMALGVKTINEAEFVEILKKYSLR
ncbi:MAG: NAD-dependent DNA ligase LigA [Clostridia bacterium]|nr:NAD-dependent DNA ligase LigA [Clostridia bacterium]